MNNNSNSASFPLASILTIIFVTLKLLGKITWSWWWVLSPLWISAAIVMAVLGVAFVICVADAGEDGVAK